MGSENDNVTSARVKRLAIIGAYLAFSLAAVAIVLTAIFLPDIISGSERRDARFPVTVTWQCVEGKCVKSFGEHASRNSSLGACKLVCNEWGSMWPRPTGSFNMSTEFVKLDRRRIEFTSKATSSETLDLVTFAINRFKKYVNEKHRDYKEINEGGKRMDIFVNMRDFVNRDLTLTTDESYTIKVLEEPDNIRVEIEAENYFGTRHALETLEQFIIFDTIYYEIIVPHYLQITDGPSYPYRGISLDTARNFFTVESIKKTLDAMSACKLNRLHWHITDTHSFPFMSKSYPELALRGAFSSMKIYQPSDVADVVQYGIERGVRVIPEFDAPAHVGEGWQGTNFTVCFNAEPWDYYCYEPPCGQFDPTDDKLYDVLEGLYGDLLESFQPDIFHMGGDEVKYECWNETSSITSWMINRGLNITDEGFLALWDHFQKSAADRLFKANGGKKLPIILWTSSLTSFEHIEKYINKDDYIIQVWEHSENPEIKGLISKGYRVIITNYDALYLDCGFGAWVGEGNNWCSPYKGWQKIYDNNPMVISNGSKSLVLGAEVALWTEQVDTSSLDGRLWPRAGALAERLWTDPETSWRYAESRILTFREKLVNMGIAADALEPEWCYQNEGHCYA